MTRAVVSPEHMHAGTLWGVRVCAVIIGLGAVASAACGALAGFTALSQNDFALCAKAFIAMLCCFAQFYVSVRVCWGLFNGSRRAQLGGIAWGVLLLLFCGTIVHHAQKPIDRKASDAQELDGPLLYLFAPTALWIVGYLSTNRVSARFLAERTDD